MTNNNRFNFINQTVPTITLFLSLFSSIVLITDDSAPSCYKNLWLLPLMTGIVLYCTHILFKDSWKDIRFLILVALFFIRNVISPFSMRFADYISLFTRLDRYNVNCGIALMVFEAVIVLLFAAYSTNKYAIIPLVDKSQHKSSIGTLILIILLLFCIVSIVLHPNFLTNYTSLFSGENIRAIKRESGGGSWATLFGVFFPISYCFACTYVLGKVNSIHSHVVKLVINCLIIIVPLLFMSSSDAFNIILCISIAICALWTGGITKGQFGALIGFGVILVSIYIFSLMIDASINANSRTIMEIVSLETQAYFTGISNVASMFNISSNYDKLTILFYDIYATIPYRNTLIGLSSDWQLSNIYAYENGFYYQIVPCIGQLFYYISILAPFAECLFVRWAFVMFNKMRIASGEFQLISRTVCFIFLIVTPVLYNPTIFFSRYYITIVPMYFIAWLSENRKIVVRRRIK